MKDAPLLANTIYMRRRRRMFHFQWRQILRKRLIFKCHHLHRDMQLGLGEQLTLAFTSTTYLPTHREQLELPPQAHPEYLHDYLLLPEEEWCPLPIKGVEGINDSYHLSLYYAVSRCLMMIHLMIYL